MKRAGLVLLIILGAATLLSSLAFSQGKDRVDPGQMFAKQCASCHTVPDPGLPADKVWMNQVRETT